ncbi:class I SAM-dependent methyltransferase [Sphingomonas koreensis]|uniref:class I SAM-dependent methyltransferase n=1 Tax=Sphingomonas koreensis TaxID=93064 RepID=UPI00234F0520|nr:class I SAM-dependent methyltransferase [Sphingomonas koreensis]MDC7808599.1 class I SAM-dependent methyltransferase [Sphingomonas koreensis]
MDQASFTPALGRPGLTRLYDLAIRLLTRERTWRDALLRQVSPKEGELILDLGCGTGSFAIMLKRAAPGARIVGLDPDPAVLAIAAAKARVAGVEIEWREGYANQAADLGEGFDKAVSSLVFHQVPLAGKREGIAAMFQAVRPGGEVHIADYALQRNRLMRGLFRVTVQLVDGVADTQPNADGMIEAILSDLTGEETPAERIIWTPTGAISLFQATRTATTSFA